MNNELNHSAPTDPINIFIGHRWDCKRSKEAAQVIKEKFNMYSEHLNFLLLSEVPAGKSERDWIRECMDKTHMMFLLCACPNESGETWAWGTLEVGWFESWSEGVKKRGDGTHLYIFHSPAVLLPPALNIHKSKACVAVPPKIKLFLRNEDLITDQNQACCGFAV